MSWETFEWITIVILWACIIQNIIIMRRRNRLLHQWENEASRTFLLDIVDATGLTPLQVQVALDASMAIFQQRIEEMRRANHGNPD